MKGDRSLLAHFAVLPGQIFEIEDAGRSEEEH
jgi:hypothetical protein